MRSKYVQLFLIPKHSPHLTSLSEREINIYTDSFRSSNGKFFEVGRVFQVQKKKNVYIIYELEIIQIKIKIRQISGSQKPCR